MMGRRLRRSRELCDRLPGSAQARRWTAVKGGEAVPKGRSRTGGGALAEPRTVAPLRAGLRRAIRLFPSTSAVVWTVQPIGLLGLVRMVTAGRSPLPIKVGVGMPVVRMPGISSRSRAHGGVRPQPGGFNHFLDVATEVGVMPLHELAPWLCPFRLIRPPGLARGFGCGRRAGRRRPGREVCGRPRRARHPWGAARLCVGSPP